MRTLQSETVSIRCPLGYIKERLGGCKSDEFQLELPALSQTFIVNDKVPECIPRTF
jgi:hypothetical protein